MSFPKVFATLSFVLVLCSSELQAQSLVRFTVNAKKTIKLIENEQFDQADVIAQRLFKQTETDFREAPDVAEYMKTIGAAYEAQGDYQTAIRFLERSLEIVANIAGENSLEVAGFSNNMGITYERACENEKVEQAYRRSIDICRSHEGMLSDYILLGALNQLAAFYNKRDEFEKAKKLLVEALKVSVKTFGEDHVNTSVCLSGLGTYYHNQKLYYEAEPLLEHALSICRKQYGDDDQETATSMNNLASLYQDVSRYEEAEALYLEALNISIEADNPVAIAISFGNIASLYRQMGQNEVAEEFYIETLALQTRIFEEGHIDILSTRLNLASFYSDLKRYEEAELVCSFAETTIKDTLGSKHPMSLWVKQILADTYFNQKRYDDARELFQEISWFFDSIHIAVKDGIDLASTPYSLNQIYDLFLSRGTFNRKAGDPEQAVADVKFLMFLALELRKQFSGREDLRAAQFETLYAVFGAMLHWQCEFHQAGSDRFDIGEAYHAMEMSRGLNLQDMINAQKINFETLLDDIRKKYRDDFQSGDFIADKLQKDLDAAQKSVFRINGEIAKQLLNPAKDEVKEKELDARLKVARQYLLSIEASIKNVSPSYRAHLGKGATVPFEVVRKQMEKNRGLVLEYYVGDIGCFLLVYGHGRKPVLSHLLLDEAQAALFDVEPGPLTSKKLQSMLLHQDDGNGLMQLIVAPFNIKKEDHPNLSPEDFDKFKKELSDKLTDRLHEKLSDLWTILIPDETLRSAIASTEGGLERLLILPDGPLAKLPFEMLIVNGNSESPRFLLDVDGLATLYAPSASMFYNLSNKNNASGSLGVSHHVLTLSGVIYEKPEKMETEDKTQEQVIPHRGVLLSTRFGQLKQLPFSEGAAERIEEFCLQSKPPIDVQKLSNVTATEENVRNNVAGRTIVHLSCHGRADNEHGNMFGCLALTPVDPENPKNDGFLELKEIFELELQACEVAILSACDTNLGPNQLGEGTWSLCRGMLIAGSKRVVTTNWLVMDDVSARLTGDYIKSICSIRDFDYAKELRSARLNIRKKRPHPYYWAPFVLVGTH